MQSERTNDNSMITVKTHYRVIGVINCIICIIGLVLNLLAIVGIATSKDEIYAETKKGNQSIKDVVISYFHLQIWIICMLSCCNYRLSKRTTPSDGRAIKQWLAYHSLTLLYIIASVIITIIFNKNLKEYHYYAVAAPSVVIIILFIELYIIRKFYNQIASGAENQPSSA